MKISVVLPTKNEPAISDTIKKLWKVLGRSIEIIVVDKSTDDTPKKAAKLGAKVVYQKSRGYGDAYLEGFKHVSGDLVLMVDSDNTYEIKDFPKMIKIVRDGGADLVLANRFSNMQTGSMSLTNYLGNKFLTWLLNSLYHFDVQDSQSGMRVITKKALKELEIFESGMPLASEMIIEARKKGLKVAEVPSSYYARKGEAKQSVINGFRIAGMTVRLIRDYNPLLTFSLLSLLVLAPGIAIGIDIILEWLRTGIIARLASVVLASMLVLTSIFLWCMGLMLDFLVKEVRKKKL